MGSARCGRELPCARAVSRSGCCQADLQAMLSTPNERAAAPLKCFVGQEASGHPHKLEQALTHRPPAPPAVGSCVPGGRGSCRWAAPTKWREARQLWQLTRPARSATDAGGRDRAAQMEAKAGAPQPLPACQHACLHVCIRKTCRRRMRPCQRRASSAARWRTRRLRAALLVMFTRRTESSPGQHCGVERGDMPASVQFIPAAGTVAAAAPVSFQ